MGITGYRMFQLLRSLNDFLLNVRSPKKAPIIVLTDDFATIFLCMPNIYYKNKIVKVYR